MCAQFIIKTNIKRLSKLLGVDIPHQEEEWDLLIAPHQGAPVLVLNEGLIKVSEMKFSLIPSWSKEPRVKFATHNARLFSEDDRGPQMIFEKPTWKKPFLKNHAIIPITRFIEPIYKGSFAGQMVAFHLPQEDILFAAAIFDQWVNKETGESIESFSIITDEPLKDVAKVGHERSPLFLPPEYALEWLRLEGKGPDLVKFLRAHRLEAHVEVESFRKMKPGWEKRIPH